ncbi:SAM-dependent methyltransferase [Paenibacillus phyllosphaerae]|uniref:SAM-dependent methyltransferase n=1 Tax=Paenibacillus phyllosphaerae TaxID=274593 RepID=A0A7W5FKM7_9BACL|nr:class I SAM-dependent methyltransferase [Paenibacillus phyllosphaerae]MBB3108134.1 SAM-dependent methyltransferase [Paenibacillus phyllosphaerae]
MNAMNSPARVGIAKFAYVVFLIVLYPFYYYVKKDFMRQVKKNLFYPSRFVSYSETRPVYYDVFAFFVNFPLFDKVYRVLPPLTGRVLQVGCGTGLMNRYLKKQGILPDMVNLDPNIHSLKYAMKWKRIDSFLQSGIEKVDLPDQSFDTILMARCFHHIRSTRKALSECSRLLKPGGKLIIFDPVLLDRKHEITEAYMANSTIDGFIWRYSEECLVRHVRKFTPPELPVTDIRAVRLPITTNYCFKYEHKDMIITLTKTEEV